MNQRPMCKARHYKTLRAKHRTVFDINCSNIFFDPSPRVVQVKTNIQDLIKLKSFCTTKETVSKVKRQPSEWEKIIANETTDKDSPKYTSSSCSSIPEK